MIGALSRQQIGIAFAVSAGLHLAALLWLAVPKMEIPQIAGGGAAFGLSSAIGTGDMVQTAQEQILEDAPKDDLADEAVEPDLPDIPDPISQPAPMPLPIAAKLPAAMPRASAQPARQTAARPAAARPAQRPPAARPKPAPAPVPLRQAAPSANRSPKADPSAKAGTDRGTGSAKSGSGSAVITNYSGRVLQQLERHRRSNTTGPGSAFVELSISTNGKLESTSISRSSGSSRFDREAMKMVKRASPFPKPPAGINRRLIVEIKGR